MTAHRRLLLLLACCVVGLLVSAILGNTFTARHSSHEGFHRVQGTDPLGVVPDLRRPRRTVLVVFDGLGYLEAETMRSLSLLRAQGQCRKTDVGALPLSRPVYAVLSTGLEQDRTGARGNDDVTPLAAQSLWEVARDAGVSVSAVSELPWWRELFPDIFEKYLLAERWQNFFELAPPAQLQLIHPLYVDETGHEHGADSDEYRQAVVRADTELSQFLATIDLKKDLVVVTADHGHSLRGGHGGRQDRVAHVLTCYAGVGVRHEAAPGEMRSTTIGPSLALLLGLRFPANMRAGDDDLDTLWQIADASTFPPGYLDERRATVDRFRAHNEAQLRAWLPASEGSWDRFHALHYAAQVRRALPFLALIAATLAVVAVGHRRRMRARGTGRGAALFGVAFVALYYVGIFGLQVGLRGSFDLSSVAYREEFLRSTILIAVLWTGALLALYWLVRRDREALMLDWSAASLVGALLGLAHVAALGWKVGYPAPSPALFFFPYFAALVLGVQNGAGLLLAGAVATRVRIERRTALTGRAAP